MQINGARVLKLTTGAATMALALTACGSRSSVTSLADADVKAKGTPTMLVQQSDDARAAGNVAAAISFAELAVTADPQSFDARVALAKAYVAAGRFHSASEAYGDMAAMRPDDNGAKFRAALAELGKGNRRAALSSLDALAGVKGLEADVGLAFALAGEADRAIAVLEPAARAEDSSVRVRQNLALAQALAGQWGAARTTASMDLTPNAVDARIAEWAELASTRDTAWRTAQVLGVTPAETDAGRPVQLAWAPPSAAVQFAESAPPAPATTPDAVATVAAAEPVAAEPVAVAAVEAPMPAPKPAADPVQIARSDVPAPAAQKAEPRVAKASATQPTLQPKPVVAVKRDIRAVAKPTVGTWVVQVGAYSKPDSVQRGWQGLVAKNKSLTGFQPTKSSIDLKGSTFHRLAVGSFGSVSEAVELCKSLRASGQSCFVRKGEGVALSAAAEI